MTDELNFFNQFSIKVVAKPTNELNSFLKKLCISHKQFNSRFDAKKSSRNNNYQSFHLNFENIDKETLDNIYKELCKHKDIKWAI